MFCSKCLKQKRYLAYQKKDGSVCRNCCQTLQIKATTEDDMTDQTDGIDVGEDALTYDPAKEIEPPKRMEKPKGILEVSVDV